MTTLLQEFHRLVASSSEPPIAPTTPLAAPAAELVSTATHSSTPPSLGIDSFLGSPIPSPTTLPPTSPLTTPSTSSSSLSPQQQNPGKIFVGGLSWETDETSLKAYFSRFGSVSDCVIMKDRHTGHPRGFGFVTFVDDTVASFVAKEKHELDGRVVEAKMAVPRGEISPQPHKVSGMANPGGKLGSGKTIMNKIFVGGLPAACTDVDLETYFTRFGPIVDAQIMYDRQTGNSRGFGFVTFQHDDTVELVVQNKNHEIMAKYVEVKRAEPRQVIDARRVRNELAAANASMQGIPSATAAALSAFASQPSFSAGMGSSPSQQNPFASAGFPSSSPSSSSSSLLSCSLPSSSVPSSSPWDKPMHPGKNMWSTGYLERTSGSGEDLAHVIHKVMYGKAAKKTLGSYGFRLAPPVRLERRYRPYT